MLTAWTIDELAMYWPILVQGALVSVALGLIGCFLVVRGMSLLGDALSHAVLPGIVVGFLVGRSLHSPWILVGASAVGLLAAVLVQAVQAHSRVKEDASLGIVFTSLFALGVVLINVYGGQADLDPGCVLYGNIENFILEPAGIWPMAVILSVVVTGLVVFYRHLLLVTFDPALAVSLGIAATAIHYGLMAALSLTIVASFEAVGAILAVALLVTPGATARLWTDRMPVMLLLAAAHGVTSALLGYWLSHESVLNTSAGGAICTAGFGLFVVSWLGSPRRGLVTRLLARRRLRHTIEVENVIKTIGELGMAGRGGGVTRDALDAELRMPTTRFARALGRATRRGWLTVAPGGGVALTEAGRQVSNRLLLAHELWEQFLTREVGVAADHAHDPAEWIEHHLDDRELAELGEALKPAGAAGDGARPA